MSIASIYISTSRNDRKVGEYKIGSAFRDAESAMKSADERRHDNYNADNSHNRPYTVDAIDMYEATHHPDCILDDDDKCPDPRTATSSEVLSWLRKFEKSVVHPAFEDNFIRLNEKEVNDDNPELKQSSHSEWFVIHDDTDRNDRKKQLHIAETEFRKIMNTLLYGTNKPLIELDELAEDELRTAIKSIDRAVNEGMEIYRAINIYCPRFGKTIYYLMLFKNLNRLYGTNLMVLPAYVLSVLPSFAKEINKFVDFQDMRYVVARTEDDITRIQSKLDNSKMVVAGVSLHIKNPEDGTETEFPLEKLDTLQRHPNNKKFIVADEADFGTHCTSSQAIIDHIMNV